MKYILSTVILFLSINFSIAQKSKTTETFDMNTSFEETKKSFKANFDVTNELILKDGSIIKIGQPMKLGESSSKISNTYETIIAGKYNIAKAMLLGPPVYASTNLKKNDYEIESIRIYRSMGSITASIVLKDISAKGLNLKYLNAYDTSLLEGELINPNQPMTRKEA